MINISSVRFKRLTRAQVCIDGTAAPLLGRAERSNPRSPEGRAGRREGLTAKSARRATIVSGHYAANVTAFLSLILFPSFDVPMTLFNCPQGGAPLLAALAASTYIRPGRAPYQGPSCNMRGHRAPRRMGPFCNTASFSQSCARSHIHLGIGHVPFVLFQ